MEIIQRSMLVICIIINLEFILLYMQIHEILKVVFQLLPMTFIKFKIVTLLDVLNCWSSLEAN
jgi:hypothetical protein